MKNTKKKPKTLRDVYMANKEAREFLAKHPEFDDRFLLQVEQSHPGFDDSGRYRLTEIEPEKREYGELLADALNALPEGQRKRALLEDYFKGLSLKEIRKKYEFKTLGSVREGIRYAKKFAINALLKSKQITGQMPVHERRFIYKGAARTLYLVLDTVKKDFVWVDEEGRAMPETVQRILDEDPNYKEWDLIVLD